MRVKTIKSLLPGLLLLLGQTPAFASEPTTVRYLNGSGVLPEGLPFSEAVQVDNLLFLSGQIGIVPGSRQLAPGGIKAEAAQTMANIKQVLTIHGYSMRQLVKCTVMLADMADWPAFNDIYQRYVEPPYPARSAFGASGLALGARVEVECVAAVEEKAAR